MNITARQGSRPVAVTITVCLLAASAGIDLVLQTLWYQSHPSSESGFYFSLVVVFLLVSVLLLFLFRGHNWARWLVVLDIVVGTIQSLVMRHGHQHAVWYFVSTLINTVAVIALFLRSSSQWFTGKPNATQTVS